MPRPPSRSQLDAERRRLFVGRDAEVALFDALLEPASTRRVAWIHGPGGTGKSELLAHFTRRASARGIAVAQLDAATLPPSESELAARVKATVDTRLGRGPVALLVLDGFEALAPLETWFRERLLPSLDERVRVVISGRHAPSSGWALHAAWRSVLTTIRLGDLSPLDARTYLARRAIPAERHDTIVQVANGLALALALFADIVAGRPDDEVRLGDTPEVVQRLLGALVDDVPDAHHRDALWCMALTRRTTEATLSAMLGRRHARRMFGYLERLSFVRTTSDGLVPHDLIRDLLAADLTTRDPGRRRVLLGHAARHYRARAELGPETFADIAFLWREEVPAAGLGVDGLYISTARPEDMATLCAWVERDHGPVSRAAFERWSNEGGIVAVVRGPDETPQGAGLYLELERLAPAAIAADPVTRAIASYPPAANARALVVRCMLDRDRGEQAAPSTMVLNRWSFERFVQGGGRTIGLSTWRDARNGLGNLPPGMLVEVPELAVELDGARYTTVRTVDGGRDLLTWFVTGIYGPLVADEPTDQTGPTDRATFDEAVRLALKQLRNREQLAHNPLVHTTLVPRTASGLDAAEALRTTILSVLAEVGDDALRRTYGEPHLKQEAVAHALGLAFGTYRRHLRHATDRLAEVLWQQSRRKHESAPRPLPRR